MVALLKENALQVVHIFRFTGNILMAIFLARQTASPAELALYEELWLGYTTLTFAFFWAFSNLLLAEYRAASARRKPVILGFFYRLSMLLGLAVGGLIAGYFYYFGAAPLLASLGFAVFSLAQAVTHLWEYRYYADNRNTASLILSGATAVLSLMALVAGFFLVGGVAGAVAGLGAAGTLRLLAFLLVEQGWRWNFRWQTRFVRLLRRKLLPMLGITFVGGSAAYVDGYLVAFFSEEAEFVLYRYGSRNFPLLVALAGGASAALVQQLAGLRFHSNQGRAQEHMRRQMRKLMHQLYPIALLVALAAPWLFAELYGSPQYAKAGFLFAVTLVTIAVRTLLFQSWFIARGKQSILFRISVAEWVLHIAFTVLALPMLGIFAPLVGVMAGNAFEKLAMSRTMRRTGLHLNQAVPWGWWLGYNAALLVTLAGVAVAYQQFTALPLW